MDRPHPSLLSLAITAVAVCFAICGNAAPVEHDDTEASLTALGDAFLDASQYAKAEASYNDADRNADSDGRWVSAERAHCRSRRAYGRGDGSHVPRSVLDAQGTGLSM